MKLKNLFFLFIIGSMFTSCNKESDEVLFTNTQNEIKLRRDGRPCNPNINFPLTYGTMASPGQLIDPDGECGDYENYTTSGSSPLEEYFDCKFDNTPVFTSGRLYDCDTFIIPLYDFCADFGDYFLFPSTNPIIDNPNSLYLDQDLLNNGIDIVTSDDFDVITNYAQSVIVDLLGGFPNGFIEVDFFTTPYIEDCLIDCNVSSVNGVLTITNTNNTLYMKVKVCKLIPDDGPVIGGN